MGTLKTPQHVLDAMVAEYLAGKTAKEAAALFGKSKGTCLNELRIRGIEARPRKTPQHILDAIADAYMAGMNAEESAGAFGLDRGCCIRELKKRGVLPRKTMSKTKVAKSRTPEHILDGIVVAAAMFGYSVAVCATELKLRGVPIRETYSRKQLRYFAKSRTFGNLFSATDEYRKWRRDVWRKANFSCMDCGAKNCYLDAHHIFRKSLYPALALDPQNGIALCKKCHRALRGKEEAVAERYAQKFGSTVRPLVYFETWPDRVK